MSNYLALLNYNLTSVNASTINYSTLIGSTIIASSIISNSTINVNNITVQNINYSTLTGSTMTTRTINYSTLTGSTILAQAVNYSTLTGSTTTNNTMVVNSTLTGSTMTVQTVNYSTLTGSTMTNNTMTINSTINVSSITSRAINYSTMTGSTMTINTLVIASTLTVSTLIATNNPAGVITSSMISLGASTNQSYTALAQGNYSTSTNWLSTLTNLSSTKFVAMSGNAQTQLAITQVATVSSVYFTSTVGTSWSTISNVSGLPIATQTNYSCGAVSGNGQYGILGTTNGYLYLTNTLTSAAGPSFTNVNPIVISNTPVVYLPFETVPGNGSTSQGSIPATLTVVGTPTSVPGIVGTNAINLANTAGGTPVNYLRGNIANYTNFTVSGWFNLQTLPGGTNSSMIFGMGTSGGNYFDIRYTGGTGFMVFYYNTSNAPITIASAPVSANIWYNFTVIFQSGSTTNVYLNNVLIGTATTTALGNPTTTFGLGSAVHFPERAFNGYIDDIRIYNSAITFTPVNWSNVALSNSGQYMLATVANGGLYMSSNFGSTWSQVSAALLQATWSLLEISSTGQYMSVYAQPVTGVIPQLSGLTTSTWTVNGVTWTASASTTGQLNPYNLFDTNTGAFWICEIGTYNTSGVYTAGRSTYVNGQGTVFGEYIRLQSSTPLQLLSYTFASGNYQEYPNGLTIAGSNDGTNWYLLQSVTMSGNPAGTAGSTTSSTYININQSGAQTMITTGGSATFNCTISPYSTNTYTYFTIIFPAIFGTSRHITFSEVYLRFTAGGQLYSTNFGSSWGNLMPANTSTLALSGSGQYALENINTTTVTTTPQLTGLTGVTSGNAVTSWTANNIIWTSSASSVYTTAFQPWIAFDNIVPTSASGNYSWASTSTYTLTSGVYNGSVSTTIAAPYSAPYRGEWLQIQSSVPVVLYNYTFGSGGTGNIPKNYLIAGSNDGTTWYPIQLASIASNPFGSTNFRPATSYLLANYTGSQTLSSAAVPAGASVTTTSYSTSSNAYTYFRIISNISFGDQWFELEEWFVNFTPTQYITSNYLSPTSSTPYTAPVFSPALTSTNVPITSAASQTGQYMVLITNNTSGANVYYSTNYGANFTGLTIGSSTMVSCAISLDGSCITVMNATTVYQLNNNSIGYSVSVGNQAGQQNQYQNAIAIGNYAGQQNQTANSIVLNATGAALNSYVPGFYVSPIQQYGASTGLVNVLGYGSDNQIVQASIISLSPSGFVGIGTTNPTSLLHVNGGNVSISGGNVSISGNVGIGTTNPINLLHVNGAMSVSWIQFNNSVVGGWHIYDNGTTNTLYILQGIANNGVYLANGGGSWTSWSDIRIKNTINPISGALNIINQLNPVTFYYKSDIKYEFLKSGFIAQEVQTILPGLVSDSGYSNEYGSNLLGVETTGFIPFIIKAIQEQNVIIQQQANKLQQQAAEITALQSTVAAQSTQVLQTQVNSQQIQIAQLMSQINQLTQRLAAANIP